jgi:hypothetical protein
VFAVFAFLGPNFTNRTFRTADPVRTRRRLLLALVYVIAKVKFDAMAAFTWLLIGSRSFAGAP